jgi:hypothetical protein
MRDQIASCNYVRPNLNALVYWCTPVSVHRVLLLQLMLPVLRRNVKVGRLE